MSSKQIAAVLLSGTTLASARTVHYSLPQSQASFVDMPSTPYGNTWGGEVAALSPHDMNITWSDTDASVFFGVRLTTGDRIFCLAQMDPEFREHAEKTKVMEMTNAVCTPNAAADPEEVTMTIEERMGFCCSWNGEECFQKRCVPRIHYALPQANATFVDVSHTPFGDTWGGEIASFAPHAIDITYEDSDATVFFGVQSLTDDASCLAAMEPMRHDFMEQVLVMQMTNAKCVVVGEGLNAVISLEVAKGYCCTWTGVECEQTLCIEHLHYTLPQNDATFVNISSTPFGDNWGGEIARFAPHAIDITYEDSDATVFFGVQSLVDKTASCLGAMDPMRGEFPEEVHVMEMRNAVCSVEGEGPSAVISLELKAGYCCSWTGIECETKNC